MSVDFASLTLTIDSSDVATGVAKLDDLTAAGTKAEGATERLGGAMRETGAATKSASAAAAELAANAQRQAAAAIASASGIGRVGSASRLSANQLQNLSFQANDVFVGLASGQKPLTVFIQQGSQIFQVMQQAGLGVGSFAKALAVTIGLAKLSSDAQLDAAAATAKAAAAGIEAAARRVASTEASALAEIALARAQLATATTAQGTAAAVARLAAAEQLAASASAEAAIASGVLATANAEVERTAKAAALAETLVFTPLAIAVAATAAALAVAYGGFKLFQSQVEKSGTLRAYVDTLGLTKKELEDLGPVTVTLGDVFTGFYRTLDQQFGLSDIFARFADGAVTAFEYLLQGAKISAAATYAAYVGAQRAIIIAFQALPSIIGEAAIGAANLAIAAINGLIQKATNGINLLIAGVNVALGAAGLPLVATIEAHVLAPLENSFAGSSARMASNVASAFGDAYAEAIGNLDRFGNALSDNITGAARDRLRGQAQGIIDDRSGGRSPAARAARQQGLSDEEKALQRATKAAQDYLAQLTRETDQIGKSAIEIKRMEVAQAAALAPTEALRQAIIAQGQAWEQATRAQNVRDFIKNTVEPLEFENSLLGMNAQQRAIATAVRELETAQIERGSEAWNRYITAITTASSAGFELDNAQRYLDLLHEINDQTRDLASGLTSAFGGLGSALGGVLTELSDYAVRQQEISQKLLEDRQKYGDTSIEYEQALGRASARRSQLEIAHYANVAGAAKGFFKEKSAGYKVLETVERAYRLFQLASAVAAIATNTTETASSVANAATRGAADQAAGAAKIFSFLGPFGFPVVAAMVAVLAGLGLASGGGGSAAPKIPTAEELQKQQGTGSVLGDSSAKSSSIARALEILSNNSNRDLEYSNGMLRALRSIENNIGNLTAALSKQLGLTGGIFDVSALKIGSTSSGGILGALFGSSTTRTLVDQGLTFNPATVSQILATGISGNSYQDVEVNKKKKFFGITTSNRTTLETTTGALGGDLTRQVDLLIGSLRSGVIQAAQVLGVEGSAAAIDAFTINIGKISLKGLTGSEIQDQLEAVFSKLGDDLAAAAAPGLEAFQKAGEGLFETLVRLAKDYTAVDVALASIGRTFGEVGASSVAAREDLISLFGSIDDFQSATSDFADKFLTDAEKIAPVAKAVTDELARLGLSGITTKDQFKQAVLGIDLTTEAGRLLYSELLNVAPAFAKVADYTVDANKKLTDSFKETVDKFTGYASSLKKYRDTLFASDKGSASAYATARNAFLVSAGLASQGDAGGLANLEGVSKTFLEASLSQASSLQQYYRDVAQVANAVDKGIFAAESTADYAQLQIDAIENSNALLATIDSNMATVANVLSTGAPVVITGTSTSPTGPVTSSGGSDSVDAMAAEISALRADLQAANAQLASNSAAILKMLQRFDGDGLTVKTDAATPLATVAA